VIAGSYTDASGAEHCYLRASDGTFTTYDVPGVGTGPGQGTFVTGINPAGATTGAWVDPSNVGHAYVRAPDGVITSFDVPRLSDKFFKKSKKTCQMMPDGGISVDTMRITATKKGQENLRTGRRAKGNQESELQVTNRPQFRASNIMAHALALYNLETAQTVSQTMNSALRQFIPRKYVAQAEQLLRNGNHQSP
jgi:hypothetical protein